MYLLHSMIAEYDTEESISMKEIRKRGKGEKWEKEKEMEK